MNPVNTVERTLVNPPPAIVKDELAHIGCGLRFARNPTQFFAGCRAEYGDTFLVDVFGYRLFCVFSPAGLRSLYELEEDKASFGFATFDLMSFKTPTEVFMDTDLKLFYELLRYKKLPGYIDIIQRVLTQELDRWGSSGELDVFDAIRTLEQRIGFGLWIGEDATREGVWQSIKQRLDVLSQESAFVSPEQTLETLVSNKSAERKALSELHEILAQLWSARSGEQADTFQFLMDRFDSFEPEEQFRRAVHNIINANQGFLSNLYAAIAWVLVNALRDPAVMAGLKQDIDITRRQHGDDFLSDIKALESMRYFEQVLMESVRMAQRSITLRKVLAPVQIDDGTRVYEVNPGCYITTMLSVTNTEGEDLARFDPDHYEGNKLRPDLVPKGEHSVSTFGHGKHACPAQKFSHVMCKIVITRLLERFDWTPLFEGAEPAAKQMGGVSRPENVTRAAFRAS